MERSYYARSAGAEAPATLAVQKTQSTILIFTGIVQPYLSEPPIFFFTIIAPVFVTYGAIKLARNISFPVNKYIISRKLEDYPDRN